MKLTVSRETFLLPAGTIAAAALLLIAASPARAELQLCNRMSYVIETAVGLESKGATVTRGWFRIAPGQCQIAVDGTVFCTSECVPPPQGCLPRLNCAVNNFMLLRSR